MTPDIEQLKATLLQEASRLEHELSSIATPDPGAQGAWNARPPEMGTTGPAASHAEASEEADVNEEREVNAAEERALTERLREVKQALARIDEGSYGICRACHAPIPTERLMANPAAEYDMEHQLQQNHE